VTRAATDSLLNQLVALSPPALADLNAAVRSVCAQVTGLPALPVETAGAPVPEAVSAFAEQFSTDVSAMTAQQSTAFLDVVGPQAFPAVALTFIADFVPRMRTAFEALGRPWPSEVTQWDHLSDPGDLLLNNFAPAVGRMRDLDPVTSELVRLRGARAHNCRLCKSLREGTALDAGGTESQYDAIDHYETSDLSPRHKAALRYVDTVIWQPARVGAVAPDVLAQFTAVEATELTLDVMRNACNKIAVAFGADAPRVTEGTERYLLGADGQPVYS